MTVGECAAKFKVSRVRVYAWIKDGRISTTVSDDGNYIIAENVTRPRPKIGGFKVKQA